jgi:hypothetical protein
VVKEVRNDDPRAFVYLDVKDESNVVEWEVE